MVLFIMLSLGSVLMISLLTALGMYLILGGVRKRYRLRHWIARTAKMKKTAQHDLRAQLEWQHLGMTYIHSPRGFYSLSSKDKVTILLNPNMETAFEIDYWTSNGKGYIYLGVIILTMAAFLLTIFAWM